MVDKNISTPQYCTDVQYMTKAEMRKYLDTQLIDYQWNLTLSYRAKHAVFLQLRDLNNQPLKLTETPAIIEKIDRCNNAIAALGEKVSSLAGDQDLFFEAEKRIFAPTLELVAGFEGKRLSESFFTAVMSEVYRPSEGEQGVYGYLLLLRELLSDPAPHPGEEQARPRARSARRDGRIAVVLSGVGSEKSLCGFRFVRRLRPLPRRDDRIADERALPRA